MVARHPVRLCATVTTQALWATRKSFACSVDVSEDVWASYAHIDGIRYLAGLSNVRERGGSESSRVVHASNGFHSNTLYILEDLLGVGQLILTNDAAAATYRLLTTQNQALGGIC